MSTLVRRALRVLALASIALTLATAPAVVAAPAAALELNPPPPDGYVCTRNGTGSVCRLTETVVLPPEPTGITCTTSSGSFEIYDEATRTLLATRWYDQDGNVVKRIRVNLFDDAQLSNPVSGRVARYTQRDRDVDVFTTPGDLSSSTFTSTNHLNAIIPGFGAVLVESGRVEISPDGELDKFSGRRDVAALFEGDPEVLARLCAGLAG
jgi:hypothetical protein